MRTSQEPASNEEAWNVNPVYCFPDLSSLFDIAACVDFQFHQSLKPWAVTENIVVRRSEPTGIADLHSGPNMSWIKIAPSLRRIYFYF